MRLSRRFLNLFVEDLIPGIRSLRCIDLTRRDLFNTTPSPLPPKENGSSESAGLPSWALAASAFNHYMNKQAARAALKMKRNQIPSPMLYVRGRNTNCLPVAGCKVLFVDLFGRAFLIDSDTREVVTMPDLHVSKFLHISVFVPCPDGGGGSLFIMERLAHAEASCSGQQMVPFEVLVYHKPGSTCYCKPLPPPPFVGDPKYMHRYLGISSYAVVGGGSHICISVEDAGTYSLDTVKHTWSHLGEWMLPFVGMVEYVPELKLWFGLSAETKHLAAADLTAMDSQPELVRVWKDVDLPADCRVTRDPQLVNLGSGRFCIARFLHSRIYGGFYGDQFIEDHFTVLTGLEVVPCGLDANSDVSDKDGKVKLEMIKHKSELYACDDGSRIKSVF